MRFGYWMPLGSGSVMDTLLRAFLNFTDELPAFGREVIPLLQSARPGVRSAAAE